MSRNTYEWKAGSRPPSGVDAGVFAKAVKQAKGDPDMLLDLARDTSHPLHRAYYAESDADWARKGRRAACTHHIAALIVVERVEGGEDIKTRAFEHVPGTAGYMPVQTIFTSPELEIGYLEEIQRGMAALQTKIDNYLRYKRAKMPQKVAAE